LAGTLGIALPRRKRVLARISHNESMDMRSFYDESGEQWRADVREEPVARHHGRWYLVFEQPATALVLPMPEVRWQTRSSAERILRTMSDFELRRRLKNIRARYASNDGASKLEGEGRGIQRAPLPAPQ
jgi:hypothetical protein